MKSNTIGTAALLGLLLTWLGPALILAQPNRQEDAPTVLSACGALVVTSSRDVSFAVDDQWGVGVAVVDRVYPDAFGVLPVYNHDIQPRDGIAMLDFDLPPLPEGAPLIGARLRAYAEGVYLQPDQPTATLWAVGNGAAWDPAAMTGQPVPAEAGDMRRWDAPHREPGWITWDVTPWVAGWYAGEANFGLRIKPSQHALNDHYYYHFSSREGAYPPEIVIRTGPMRWCSWLPALEVARR